MPQLTDIDRFNWKKLNAVLDQLKEFIDRNEPLEGDGIRVVETNNGKLISVAQDTKGSAAGAPTQSTGGSGGPTGAFVQIQAIDPVTKNIVTLNVFSDGNGFSTTENDWVSVNSVDPATCQAVPLTLLKKPT